MTPTTSAAASRSSRARSFADTITGTDADHRERFTGGLGNDTHHRRSAAPTSSTRAPLRTAPTPITAAAGIDLVDYSQRSKRVEVHMEDVTRNDGEVG